jgi:hypothetical protein
LEGETSSAPMTKFASTIGRRPRVRQSDTSLNGFECAKVDITT